MNTEKFIDACRKQKLIDLYDVALGYIMDEIPQDDLDKHNLMIMTIDLLADTLYEEKKFSKAESLAITLKECQPDLYNDTIFSLLPELLYYNLFRNETSKLELYLEELSLNADEDFLLFVHILDVFDAYGKYDIVKKNVSNLIKNNTSIDKKEIKILKSYLSSIPVKIKDHNLIAIRKDFVEYCYKYNISVITAENISDALFDFIESESNKEKKSNLINEDAFRQYIYRLLDIEFLDTFEYAASVLWGAVYIIDLMQAKNYITAEDAEINRNIICRTKAFLLVNIPWDAYWRLRFIHTWKKPLSISEEEFANESYLFNHTLPLRPKDVIGASIFSIFGEKGKNISYYQYLEAEQKLFEENLKEELNEEFGANKKKDSMFPYFNYLSGESENEIRPEPLDENE